MQKTPKALRRVARFFSKCRPLRRTLSASLLCCAIVIALPAHRATAVSRDEVNGEGRWTDLGNGVLKDARTGLEWTKNDNGGDIDWNEAKSYCDGRRTGWRLPSLQELKAIFDPTARGARCAEALCQISSQFNLSGSWFWSATQVGRDATDGSELAWGVLMVNGAQTETVRDASYGSRTLCVRGSRSSRSN
jgi:hypothetical protein